MASNVRIEEDDGEYNLYFPYNDELQQELKDDYGAYWDQDSKCWVLDGEDVSEHELQQLINQYYPGSFR